MSAVAWSRTEYARLAADIEDSAGLVFSEARRLDVERTFMRHAERTGARDAYALRTLIRRDAAAREALVAELTVGETYFFRDRPQIEALERDILPALTPPRGSRGLRLWSAGCASGEEAYTLAIVLDRLNLGTNSTILGTDIARPRLEHAQRGVYSAWSLRGVTDEERKRYFTPAGRYHRLRDRYRHGVEFRYLNLAEDAIPSLESGVWGFDVILCRNVLIYFRRSTVAAAAERLISCLAPDGWLLLGATDPLLDGLVRCQMVQTAAGIAYRRLTADAVSFAPPQPPPVELPGAATAPEPPVVPVPALPPSPPTPESPHTPPANPVAADVDDPLEHAAAAFERRDYPEVARIAATAAHVSARLYACWVRALANQGTLAEAGRVARAALEHFPLDPELLFLSAVLLGEAQHTEAAIATLRRALYLDRSLVLAHVALARLLARSGQRAAARRSLRNARELLGRMPGDATVPLSDAEPAQRLLAIVTAQLSLLEAA